MLIVQNPKRPSNGDTFADTSSLHLLTQAGFLIRDDTNNMIDDSSLFFSGGMR